MKYLIVLLFTITSVLGQEVSRTLYVSDVQNVVLFFESPIKQAITGHSNFQFAFDTQKDSNYGIIRGQKGVQSNLHIITADNNVYVFILKYKELLNVFNHYVKKKDAVGNVKGKTKLQETSADTLIIKPSLDKNKIIADSIITHNSQNQLNEEDLYLTNPEIFFKKRSFYTIANKPYYKRHFAVLQDIYFYFDDIRYIRNELYIKLRILNNSGVDYQVNFLGFSIVARKKSKKSTSQSISLKPLFIYEGFNTIAAGDSQKAVYVFDKFGIDKNKKIQIELNEKKGERNLKIYIPYNIINNPNK